MGEKRTLAAEFAQKLVTPWRAQRHRQTVDHAFPVMETELAALLEVFKSSGQFERIDALVTQASAQACEPADEHAVKAEIKVGFARKDNVLPDAEFILSVEAGTSPITTVDLTLRWCRVGADPSEDVTADIENRDIHRFQEEPQYREFCERMARDVNDAYSEARANLKPAPAAPVQRPAL